MTTTTEHVPAGTVLQVDPTTLVLDDNIRADAQLADVFVESVRTNGVMVPLQVRQDPLGQLLIIDGQRRYLAAIRTEQATVPVIVVAGIGDDGDRITNQWILNEHRTALTTAERAAAVEQLALFGRSTSAIAKKLGASEVDVIAGLAVAKTPKVLEALAAEPAMDLVTAAKLAMFADDDELFAELTETASIEPESLDHEIEWARQKRAVRDAKAARAAELEAEGVHVVADDAGQPMHVLSATPPTDSLAPPQLTDEEHATCPHRAVRVSARWEQPDPLVFVHELCLDYETAGHHKRYERPLAEPEDAAVKSAERRHVISQNAASDAAQEVRRRYIADHLLWERDPRGRMSKVPDGAVQHIAAMIEAAPGSVSGYEAGGLLSEWTTGKTTPPPGSSRTIAERALLRRVLAAGEMSLARDFWRQVPKPFYHSSGTPISVQHLRQLEKWGYGLAPIEREYLEAWDAAVAEKVTA